MTDRSPALSIGLAVRNGRHCVGRCIESILSQDFTDLELVVFDNVSDDGTIELLEQYARSDRRFRLSVNEVNVGSHENMRRVLDAARGRFFRWISADDWLEPQCLSSCLSALERHPDAIGVTARFTIHTSDGATRYEEYRGAFPDSRDPVERFERMLWFFHAGDGKYDPMYGMYRRDHLVRTGFPHTSERTDWLTSIELALDGPIIHLDQRLANRTRDYSFRIDQAAFRRRLDPGRGEQLKTSPSRLSHDMYALAASADLSPAQLRSCKFALRRFWLREATSRVRSRAANIRYGLFGS